MDKQDELVSYFTWKCKKGLEERGLSDKKEYQDRLDAEIQIIQDLGFCSYFLVVQDFVVWAASQQILNGYGRGSAAGSLCCYCLQITQVDPIKYGLIFSRFLNYGRKNSFPDIDCDIEDSRRDEVIEYARQKYGADNVAHLGTYGSMKTKGAIRDVTRVLGLPYELGDRLSALAPQSIIGNLITLKESYGSIKELHEFRNRDGSDEQRVLMFAEELDGKHRSFGTHASGVLVAPHALRGAIPLAVGKDGEWVSQVDMHDAEDLGYIKYDFLGLTALSVVSKCLSFAGVALDIYTLPLDDEATFANLKSGDTVGIFQLETSAGMKDLLMQLQPTCIEDVSALVALYRPGPIEAGLLNKYLSVRSGKTVATYEDPALEPILKETCGVCVYQEQAIRIAQDIAGFSETEADHLRKVIGKKLVDQLPKYEKQFKDGIVANGHKKSLGTHIWKELEAHAKYQFNKSHSLAYGMLTYCTAYLKAHHPRAYMCALLECNKNNPTQIEIYLAECKRLGIKVLGPDINESGIGFSVTPGGRIRFGLAAIKNLGDKPVEHILEVRGQHPYPSIIHFCDRVDISTINKKKMESLVLSGAFDSTGETRASLMKVVEDVLAHKLLKKRYLSKLETYDKKILKHRDREDERAEDKAAGRGARPPLKLPEKPEEPEEPVIHKVDEMPLEELLSAEKELLGLFLSGHPLDGFERSVTIPEVLTRPHGYKAQFLGVLSSLKESSTKKGRQQMATCAFEDQDGRIEATIFPKAFKKVKRFLLPATALRISGNIEVSTSGDARSVKCVIEDISLQDRPTQPILAELPITQETLEGITILMDSNENTTCKGHISLHSEDGSVFHGRELVEFLYDHDKAVALFSGLRY